MQQLARTQLCSPMHDDLPPGAGSTREQHPQAAQPRGGDRGAFAGLRRTSYAFILASVCASFALDASRKAGNSELRNLQALFFLLGAAASTAWAFLKLRGTSNLVHHPACFAAAGLFATLGATSFLWLPLAPANPHFFLQHLCIVAVLPVLCGRSPEEGLPLLLAVIAPVHLALDAAWQRRIGACLLPVVHPPTPPPCTAMPSPNLASLLLLRGPLCLGVLLALLLLVSLFSEDPREAAAAARAEQQQQQQRQQQRGHAATENSRSGLQHGQEGSHAGAAAAKLGLAWPVEAFRHVRRALRAKWLSMGAEGLTAWLWRPLSAAVICIQIVRLAKGASCNPVEVLLALVVGIGAGSMDGKDAAQTWLSQLMAMTELAHDLVPSHVADMLLLHRQRTPSGSQQGVASRRPSQVGSVCSTPLPVLHRSSSFLVSRDGSAVGAAGAAPPIAVVPAPIKTKHGFSSPLPAAAAVCLPSQQTAAVAAAGLGAAVAVPTDTVAGYSVMHTAPVLRSMLGDALGDEGGDDLHDWLVAGPVDGGDGHLDSGEDNCTQAISSRRLTPVPSTQRGAATHGLLGTLAEDSAEWLQSTGGGALTAGVHAASTSARPGVAAMAEGDEQEGEEACIEPESLDGLDGLEADVDSSERLLFATGSMLTGERQSWRECEGADEPAPMAPAPVLPPALRSATAGEEVEEGERDKHVPPGGGAAAAAAGHHTWSGQLRRFAMSALPAAAPPPTHVAPSGTPPMRSCSVGAAAAAAAASAAKEACGAAGGGGLRPSASGIDRDTAYAQGPSDAGGQEAKVVSPDALKTWGSPLAPADTPAAPAAAMPLGNIPTAPASGNALAASAAGPPSEDAVLARGGGSGLDGGEKHARSGSGGTGAGFLFGSGFTSLLSAIRSPTAAMPLAGGGRGDSSSSPPRLLRQPLPRRSSSTLSLVSSAVQFGNPVAPEEDGGSLGARGQLPPAPQQGELLAFSHSAVTVLFADIVGFTTLSKSLEPFQVFQFLNELYARYDAVVDSFNVYKVETIGDCYMCATGLLREDPDHAVQMVRFAKEMQRQAAEVLMPDGSGLPVRVRVGIHSGPLLSGVIGRIRRRYCVVGSTVNLASRMESTGIPGRVHISGDTHALVRHLADEFVWECRGEVGVKGVGAMVTYLLAQGEEQEGEFDGEEASVPIERSSA